MKKNTTGNDDSVNDLEEVKKRIYEDSKDHLLSLGITTEEEQKEVINRLIYFGGSIIENYLNQNE